MSCLLNGWTKELCDLEFKSLLRTLIRRQFELLTLSICLSHKAFTFRVEFVHALFML